MLQFAAIFLLVITALLGVIIILPLAEQIPVLIKIGAEIFFISFLIAIIKKNGFLVTSILKNKTKEET